MNGRRQAPQQSFTPQLREELGNALSADLSSVSVSNSDRLADMKGADGIAEGSNITLGADADEWVMAHEAYHTVQRRSADPTEPDSPEENDANRFADAFVSGDPVGIARAAAMTASSPVTGTGPARSPNRNDLQTRDQFLSAEAHSSGEAGYTYADRGGWVDRMHMAAHGGNGADVMQQLMGRAGTVSVHSRQQQASPSIGGHRAAVHFDLETRYAITYPQGAVTENWASQVTSAIMSHHDVVFEWYQSASPSGLSGSSFTVEDLPSDRIGTEVGMRTYRAWHRDHSNEPMPSDDNGMPDMRHARVVPYYMAALTEVLDSLGSSNEMEGTGGIRAQFDADSHAGLIDQHNHSVRPLGDAAQNPASFLSGRSSPADICAAVTVIATNLGDVATSKAGPLPTTPTVANSVEEGVASRAAQSVVSGLPAAGRFVRDAALAARDTAVGTAQEVPGVLRDGADAAVDGVSRGVDALRHGWERLRNR